jgi:hypothetical protein
MEMARQFESPQLSLFNEDKPSAVLEPAQKVALATLVQLLLREVATALANGESGDEQDHV